jgi:hypothetical protein
MYNPFSTARPIREGLRATSRIWARFCPGFFEIGHFRWVRLVSFLVAQKIDSLKTLAFFAKWVRFMRLFGTSILGGLVWPRKTKHEGTKEDEDTKARRISISARGARK